MTKNIVDCLLLSVSEKGTGMSLVDGLGSGTGKDNRLHSKPCIVHRVLRGDHLHPRLGGRGDRCTGCLLYAEMPMEISWRKQPA